MARSNNPPVDKKAEQTLDDALDDSFPASDPLAFTPRRGGQRDKKAPTGAIPDGSPFLRQKPQVTH